ncbi:MAG: cytochrome c4, partial [Limnohabitans sp.]
MAGSVLAATPAPKAEKPDLAKGEAIVGGVCAACHMADGNSTTPVNP